MKYEYVRYYPRDETDSFNKKKFEPRAKVDMLMRFVVSHPKARKCYYEFYHVISNNTTELHLKISVLEEEK